MAYFSQTTDGLPDWDDSYNIAKYGKFGHEHSGDVREEPSQFSYK
jgi:hypothetical protein